MDPVGGVFVPAYAIWTGITGDAARDKYYSCPIAEASTGVVPDILALWRALQVEGVSLGDLVDEPTEALLDAMGVIGVTQSDIRAERARLAAQAKARKNKR